MNLGEARQHSGTRCPRFAFMRVRWYGPHTVGRVDLRPLGPANLAPPRRRQQEELESQLDDRSPARSPDGLNGRRHVAMRQRPHVLHGRPLRSEDRPEAVAWVVRPQLHRHGPFQHRSDALAHPPGGLRLLVLMMGVRQPTSKANAQGLVAAESGRKMANLNGKA